MLVNVGLIPKFTCPRPQYCARVVLGGVPGPAGQFPFAVLPKASPGSSEAGAPLGAPLLPEHRPLQALDVGEGALQGGQAVALFPNQVPGRKGNQSVLGRAREALLNQGSTETVLPPCSQSPSPPSFYTLSYTCSLLLVAATASLDAHNWQRATESDAW